ncbi:RNA polymerase sigma-70 factor [Pedobacter nyackensis]|uniref:RNA polymerase sigma-70 factor, ECF subfamily n=1 Tax=Pedobacter nyackensis TaxID=475255 RepID=A0A1W2C2U1_9SPHI|nr:RNA polymerase sigma-70 factor [Pedobacter nyackensis]SMC79411.1 RNA polymerase sigma-70 factor, ECF subfamily [Pedobacter nyackensis]
MVDTITGKDLHAIISEGQIQEFTKFYSFFFEKLLLTSDKYVKDLFIGEEIVQNVFLKIWETPENLEEIKSIKSYLYKSVINASINHVNRQKNIEQHHQKIAADYSEEHLIELDEENELIILLHREIDKLPPQCRKVFKLNRFEHLKYKEIAMLLDISEKTVENHIGIALKTLRKAMLAKETIYNAPSSKLIFRMFLY